MKLIIQIPCYNEEQTLPLTLADIPSQIPGIDQIETMIIDDGSNDKTVSVARALGVDHIVLNKHNLGLAATFRTGLDACLQAGADIIVNTDGDNQYCGADIPKLIEPILAGRADLVIGDRQTQKIAHFSPLKKFLQAAGSHVVSKLAGLTLPDAVSGFRAFSREAALRTNIVSSFSYTIETAIQAGKKNLAVESVAIRTNSKTRDSRLFRSLPSFILNSVETMIRMYMMYQPLRFFVMIGAVLTLIGLIPIARFLIFALMGDSGGHIQSLVLGGTLVIMGFLSFLAGLVADLISFNRQLMEMTLERIRRADNNKP